MLIGDSTVKNGSGKGITTSGAGAVSLNSSSTAPASRSRITHWEEEQPYLHTEGLWDKVYLAAAKELYSYPVWTQRRRAPHRGRARASLKGTGDESEIVVMERTAHRKRYTPTVIISAATSVRPKTGEQSRWCFHIHLATAGKATR